ncbi:hypothetical protein CEP54_009133 [Fusarium duplospermum]|uniref:DUF7924 domain-containing protein n=1 Tax=Fusarium duplospermum TaxID=1325734 RepID=A0A428PS19_9HYPO|nr:hypothetical protein CEP54_009133 [Fusarium duplospermum]
MTFSSIRDEPPSNIPPSPLTSPTLSEGSRTLSDHSSDSGQSSSPILTRWPSPVFPNNESLSDEYETFSEYADDRNPLVWYRVSLRGPYPEIPGAVSRLINHLENRQKENHPPWSSGTRRRFKRKDTSLSFQGPISSLFPGGHPITQHNVDGEVVYHHLMRRANSQTPTEDLAPDVIYGYPEEALHCLGGIPSWVMDDGKAAEASLFYPFLTVQIQDHDLRSDGDIDKVADECMITSSISVRMLDKLNQRLAIRQRGEQSTTVNSAAFSIAMNGSVARLYVTFAWDETRDYVHSVDSFVLADQKHHERFHRYVQNIIDWGKNERLQEIRDAIEVIETHNPPWYPRYLP